MIEASAINNEISRDFDEAVRATVEVGVTCIDIAQVGGRWVTDLDPGEIDSMRQTVRAAGLRVGSIDGPAGRRCLLGAAAAEEEDRALRRALELATTFGAQYVRIFSPAIPDPRAPLPRPDIDARLSEIVDALTPWAEAAAAAGVTLTMETEDSTYTGSCAEMRRVVDAVGHPALAVLWDVMNSWKLEGAHPKGYPHIRGYIRRLHLKDASLTPGNPDAVLEIRPLGSGDVPFITSYWEICSRTAFPASPRCRRTCTAVSRRSCGRLRSAGCATFRSCSGSSGSA